MDDGDNVIEYNDLTYNPLNGQYYFHLNRDVVGGMTVAAGLGNIIINGNGHTIHANGIGGAGLYFGPESFGNYGIGTFNLNISGDFHYGVRGAGLHSATFCDVDVDGALVGGMMLAGDGMLVRYSDVTNISGDIAPVFGIDIRGSNNVVDQAYVRNLDSLTEAYAVGFSSYDDGNNLLSNSTLDGTGSTGWTFGFWSDNDANSSTIYNSHVHGWDFGTGSVFATNIDWSTIDASVIDYGAPSNFTNGSAGIERFPLPIGDQVLYGDQFANFIRGGDGNDLIHGASGYDDVMGGLGSDTFLFIDPNPSDGAYDRIIDFRQGEDVIRIEDVNGMAPTRFQEHGVYAVGDGAVMVLNQHNNMLYYDPDGYGGQDWVEVAYLFEVNLTASDFVFT